jgi:hypothetical protein
MTSRWKCPKCGSENVQVAIPTWYRESSDGTLTFVNTDEEADPLYWVCDDCEETGHHEPDRVNP